MRNSHLLTNAVQQKDTASVLSVVRAFHFKHLHSPHSKWDIHNLDQGRGAQLLEALQTSVEHNYVGGMIVLMNPHRVQRVLQNLAAQNENVEGVTHLKFIAAVFEDNTNNIAQVWRDFVLGGTSERSLTQIIDFLRTYANALEAYVVAQEKQRLNQAVEECSPKISPLKKI